MGLEPDQGRDGLWSLRYWRGLLGSARPRHDQKQFTALLIGEDPLNVDKLYKKLLLRSGGNGAIAGVAITSASGIEIVFTRSGRPHPPDFGLQSHRWKVPRPSALLAHPPDSRRQSCRSCDMEAPGGGGHRQQPDGFTASSSRATAFL